MYRPSVQFLEDETQPGFLREMIEMYVNDTDQKLDRIRFLLSSVPDGNGATELDSLTHQLKGSSASMGASRVAQLFNDLRHAVHGG